MVAFNRLLTGRIAQVSSSRVVSGSDNVAASDLNNEIVYNSAFDGVLTLPAGNGLGASVDDMVLVYQQNTGKPSFAWTGGTIKSPAGLPAAVQDGYIAVKWSPLGEWVRV